MDVHLTLFLDKELDNDMYIKNKNYDLLEYLFIDVFYDIKNNKFNLSLSKYTCCKNLLFELFCKSKIENLLIELKLIKKYFFRDLLEKTINKWHYNNCNCLICQFKKQLYINYGKINLSKNYFDKLKYLLKDENYDKLILLYKISNVYICP